MTQPNEQTFAIEKVGPSNLQETAATSRAAAATALVQARCIMAIQRPRDWDTVRTKLLKECLRPAFAKAAVYRKPCGGGKYAEGASVRFAEAAMRYTSNVHVSSETIHEDEASLTIQVMAMDLETNVTTSAEVRVQKTVERASASGRTVLGKRTNSQGNATYIVAATDDEILTKTNALLSKARRNLIMQLLPGDIAEECRQACKTTTADRDAKDPDSARKQMYDDFAEYDVTPAQIKAYLGHSNAPSVKELQALRELHAALSTGETTWTAITEDQRSDAERGKAEVLGAITKQPLPAVVVPELKTTKPAGDLEDAIARLTNAPPDEVDHIANELRTEYRWTAEQGAKLKATLAKLKPVSVDPDADGR
jgi:hypothetical protein